ncbi:MAG: hypothetical protein IPO62_17820 [Saprospiraceae bacterium]|nr:hypothetical protein [Saprospiraceae bacterium]
MLSVKEFITITDQYNNPLNSSISRKGKSFIYYSLNPMHFMTSINAQNDTRAMHKSAYNKRKKENITKRNDLPDWQNRIQTIGEILKGTGYKVSYPN